MAEDQKTGDAPFMTNVLYPTADFSADEFHQKYGFNDIKSDFANTYAAEGQKTFDTGLAMNILSKGIISYDEAHNQPAADKYIDSYNTLMDQFNMVLKHSNHPVAKLTGGISGFITQPTVALGGALLEVAAAGLSAFIGVESAGFMASLTTSRLASLGTRTLLRGTEAAVVTAPEAISHAYLAQTTPIHDDYNYMDSLREAGQNFLLSSIIHVGVIEPIGAGIKAVKGKYTAPVQVATTPSLREAAGKVEDDLSNENEPNAKAELHQGFNDQRRSLKDPSIEEVTKSGQDVIERINKVDNKIADLKEEAKKPVEPTKTMSAGEISNRITRIEAKPEEVRTDLEKNLLNNLPRTEAINNLTKAAVKNKHLLTPEDDELLDKLKRSPQQSINNEQKLIEERQEILQQEINRKIEQADRFRKIGKVKRAEELEAEIKVPQAKITEFNQRTKSFEKPTTVHNEPVLQQIDKLEDQRANMVNALDNHVSALQVLTKPQEAVTPEESETKPLFYNDTDSIEEAAKTISPEAEISDIPEGIKVDEANFSEAGKEELAVVREEIADLPNYKKLISGIADCISNLFYK